MLIYKRNVSNTTDLTNLCYLRRGKFQSSSITTDEVKESYQAIRLHFNNKNYHYGKYNGKLKKQNFSDMSVYSVIAKGKKKKDFPDFFIPALFHNPKVTLTYFTTEDYAIVWRYWNAYQNSPKHFFEHELLQVKANLKKKNLNNEALFSAKGQEIPLLYKMLIRSEISPQTVNYLNDVFDFRIQLEKYIEEKILFPKINQRLSKLAYFMKKQEQADLKKIVRDIFLLDK